MRAALTYGETWDSKNNEPKNNCSGGTPSSQTKDPATRFASLESFPESPSRLTGPSSSEEEIKTEAESSDIDEVNLIMPILATTDFMDGGDRSTPYIPRILRKSTKIRGWSNKEATDSGGKGGKGGKKTSASAPASPTPGGSTAHSSAGGSGGAGGTPGSPGGGGGGEDPTGPPEEPLIIPEELLKNLNKQPTLKEVSNFKNYLRGKYGRQSPSTWKSPYEVSTG